MDLDIDACYRAICTRDPRFDGRLFSGVKTTGVYCRPICPARTPKRENMLFFPTAAAAQEAGFRPCLRCRPETVPELAAWRGTSNTVSRALSLIEHGALDEAGVGELADRLGVGERQLRRLFREHVGASPIAVRQTRRVLLALQLIRETRLSIADVALASGFGSIRRFNEVFQRLYRRSPTSLRRTSGTPSAGPQGEVSILLRYRPPYDWPAMLEFLRDRAIPGVESVSDGRYARTIEIEGTHGVVIVEAAAGHALKAAIRFPRLSALPAVIARIRRLFDLAADPHAIDAHLAEDSVLAPLVAARPGLRVPGAWDGFELVVRAVLGQQITVRAAAGLAAKLVARYGEQLRDPSLAVDGLSHVFPRPECVALADPATLAMPMTRGRALTSLASAVARDPGILCSSQEPAVCVKRLRAFAGVGDWTAEYIAMRQLREPDAFPADDVGLQRAIARRDGRRPTSRELVGLAERWRPWRAYAAQHLWTSLARG